MCCAYIFILVWRLLKNVFSGLFFYTAYSCVKSLRFYFLRLIYGPAFLLFSWTVPCALSDVLSFIRQTQYHPVKACRWMDVVVVFHASAVLLYLILSSVLDNVAVPLITEAIGSAKPQDIFVTLTFHSGILGYTLCSICILKST